MVYRSAQVQDPHEIISSYKHAYIHFFRIKTSITMNPSLQNRSSSCVSIHVCMSSMRHGRPHGTVYSSHMTPRTLQHVSHDRYRMYSASEEDQLASVEEGELSRAIKGYRVFPMDGCSFLIKQPHADLLDLSGGILVVDEATQETRDALAHDESLASASPRSYQEVEWASHFPGNVLEDKEPNRWVHKIYLIAIDDSKRLDFENVFVLDASDGSVSSCTVTRLAPPDTPEHLLQLRIRESGLTIDTMESLPGPEDVVRSKLAGVPAKSALEEALYREQQEEDASLNVNDQGEDDEDIIGYEDGEDDNLSDFLVEVDDDSDSEFDDGQGDGDFEDEGDEY